MRQMLHSGVAVSHVDRMQAPRNTMFASMKWGHVQIVGVKVSRQAAQEMGEELVDCPDAVCLPH